MRGILISFSLFVSYLLSGCGSHPYTYVPYSGKVFNDSIKVKEVSLDCNNKSIEKRIINYLESANLRILPNSKVKIIVKDDSRKSYIYDSYCLSSSNISHSGGGDVLHLKGGKLMLTVFADKKGLGDCDYLVASEGNLVVRVDDKSVLDYDFLLINSFESTSSLPENDYQYSNFKYISDAYYDYAIENILGASCLVSLDEYNLLNVDNYSQQYALLEWISKFKKSNATEPVRHLYATSSDSKLKLKCNEVLKVIDTLK